MSLIISYYCVSLLLITTFISVIRCGEDYYKVFDIERDASTREIRRAFKKLALRMHPDKNQGDPDAHEKFVKINRAYEVLKDDDLRKKYDLHGEEGLEELNKRGRNYESWNFYDQSFGLYDDDPEIITLDRTQYEQSVLESTDFWFINFYSARCGHCHDLAPAWREMAKQLEGVIRIGAVNCLDDWMLCRQQHIRSYPSLMFYPQKEDYNGDTDVESMIKYAMKKIRSQLKHFDLRFDTYQLTLTSPHSATGSLLPWIVSFCSEDSTDCLPKITRLKLSAMLAGLVNIGKVDCDLDKRLCRELGISGDAGVAMYYPHLKKTEDGRVTLDTASAMKLTSLDAQEIGKEVLKVLPDIPELTATALQEVMSHPSSPHLIHFTSSSSPHSLSLELRRLPPLLTGDKISFYRVDCSRLSTHCQKLKIHKFPTFALFKPREERSGWEFYHGRASAHDLASFARESAQVSVISLSEADFPSVTSGDTLWFVDYFTPWCPPCMQLLPELKKVVKMAASPSSDLPSSIRYEIRKMQFGTVDCTTHSTLCSKNNIRSYPAMLIYNGTNEAAHSMTGFHPANEVFEFIEDSLMPQVINLDESSFSELVFSRDKGRVFLVDYFNPHCGPCKQLAPEWRKLAKKLKDFPQVSVGQVDCIKMRSICQQESVSSYPTIRLYPAHSRGTKSFVTYNEWMRSADHLLAWSFQHLPSSSSHLSSSSFSSEVLKSEDPWLIDFYTPWCGHCQHFAPTFERIAQLLNETVHTGKVNCDEEKGLCGKASVNAYPTIRFYTGSNNKNAQEFYGQDINSQRESDIIQFIRNRIPANRKLSTVASPTSASSRGSGEL